MAQLQIVYWRDIPAQVMVKAGRRNQAKRELSLRFTEAIDMAAMRTGAAETDEYLAEWRRGDSQEVGDDLEAEVQAAADAIENEYDKDPAGSLGQKWRQRSMNMSKISASMEVSAKHVIDGKLDGSMLPQGTRVYITDVGVDPLEDMIAAARKVTDMGYQTVPHIPARRIESEGALERRLSGFVNDAGVNDILIIAGEADEQMGPYSQTLDILQTGLIDKLGIQHVAVGGHPEGNPAYDGQEVMEVLRNKVGFGDQSDAEFRITTQFGFDGPNFIKWVEDVAAAGITAPIHLGVAGPAKITTLIKYAALCGVGNSLNFFRKRTSAIAQLATKHSPEDVVGPLEAAWHNNTGNLVQIHVFPFGGLQASATWLTERGSFEFADQQASAVLA